MNQRETKELIWSHSIEDLLHDLHGMEPNFDRDSLVIVQLDFHYYHHGTLKKIQNESFFPIDVI